jgi:hypothetical protein
MAVFGIDTSNARMRQCHQLIKDSGLRAPRKINKALDCGMIPIIIG